MKQIIGYMKYDYINIKRGIWLTAAVFGVVSVVFSLKSAVGAVGYMLFGALILASTMFIKQSVQTVAFDALVPGSTFQKVTARYVGSFLMAAFCGLAGFLLVSLVRLAGFGEGKVDIQLLSAVAGISLFLLAVQNLAFYALLPMMGMQFVNLIRMVPGFILFFGVMNEKTQEILSGFLQYSSNPGLVILGMGAASLLAGIFLSCLIVRSRDGE